MTISSWRLLSFPEGTMKWRFWYIVGLMLEIKANLRGILAEAEKLEVVALRRISRRGGRIVQKVRFFLYSGIFLAI